MVNNTVNFTFASNGKTIAKEFDDMKKKGKEADASVKELIKDLNETDKQSKKVEKLASSTDKLGKELKDTSTDAKKTKKELEDLEKTVEKTDNASVNFKSALVGMFAGVAAGLSVQKVVGELVNFQVEMAKVKTLLPSVSDSAENAALGINKISEVTGADRSAIATAYYDALSSGVDITNDMGDANEFMMKAIKLSKGGFTDAQTAVDGLTTVMNSYKLEMDQTSRVSDILAKTQDLGKTTVGELAQSLGDVIPIAADAGIEFEQVGAGYAVLTSNGINANKASTAMRNIFTELNNAVSPMGKVFEKVAKKDFKTFIAEGGNVQEAMKMVKDYAEKTKTPIAQIVGKETIAAFNTLANSTDGYASALSSMKNSAGATDKAFSIATDNIKDNFAKAFNQIIGVVEPTISAMLSGANDLIVAFTNLSPEMKQVVISMVALGGAALTFKKLNTVFGITKNITEYGKKLKDVGVSMLTIIRSGGGVKNTAAKMASSLGGMVSPIGLATAGIGLLVAGLMYFNAKNEEVVKSSRVLGEAIAKGLDPATLASNPFTEKMTEVNDSINKNIEDLNLYTFQLANALSGEEAEGYSQKIATSLKNIKDNLKSANDTQVSTIESLFAKNSSLDPTTQQSIINSIKDFGKEKLSEIEKIETENADLAHKIAVEKDAETKSKLLDQLRDNNEKVKKIQNDMRITEEQNRQKGINNLAAQGLLSQTQIDEELKRRTDFYKTQIAKDSEYYGSAQAALEMSLQQGTITQDNYNKQISSLQKEQQDKTIGYMGKEAQSIADMGKVATKGLKATYKEALGIIEIDTSKMTDTQKDAVKRMIEAVNKLPKEYRAAALESAGLTVDVLNDGEDGFVDANEKYGTSGGKSFKESYAKEISDTTEVETALDGYNQLLTDVKGLKIEGLSVDKGKILQSGKDVTKIFEDGVAAGANSGDIANGLKSILTDKIFTLDNNKLMYKGNDATALYIQSIKSGMSASDLPATIKTATENGFTADGNSIAIKGANVSTFYLGAIKSGMAANDLATYIPTLIDAGFTFDTNGMIYKGSNVSQMYTDGIKNGVSSEDIKARIQQTVDAGFVIDGTNVTLNGQNVSKGYNEGIANGLDPTAIKTKLEQAVPQTVDKTVDANVTTNVKTAEGSQTEQKIKETIPSNVNAAVNVNVSATSNGDAVGKQIVDSIINAITSKIGEAKNAGTSVANAANTGANTGTAAMVTTGGFVGQGFVNGVNGKVSLAEAAGRNLANATKRGTEKQADIHSPSRVAKALGGYWGQGFYLGVDSKTEALLTLSKNIIGKLTNATKQAISDAKLEQIMSSNTVASLESQMAKDLAKATTEKEKQYIMDYYKELVDAEKKASEYRVKQLQLEETKNAVYTKYDNRVAKLEAEKQKKLDKAKTTKQRKSIEDQYKRLIENAKAEATTQKRIADQNYQLALGKLENEKMVAEESLKLNEKLAEDKAELEAKAIEDSLRNRGLISPSIETGSAKIINMTQPMYLNFVIEEVRNLDQLVKEIQRDLLTALQRSLGGKLN